MNYAKLIAINPDSTKDSYKTRPNSQGSNTSSSGLSSVSRYSHDSLSNLPAPNKEIKKYFGLDTMTEHDEYKRIYRK